jgi:hypothetical protein
MDFKPINTGRKTTAGRPLWKNPETGELYSEKSRTIPLKTDPETGEPMPGTKWVNVPSVFDGGKIMDDEDFLARFYKSNGYKDPLTNKKLQMFGSAEEAVEAAKKRSSELLGEE